MIEYNISNLTSVDAIFDFFNKSNYKVEGDKNSFLLSGLLKKSIEGDAWLVVDQTNLMVLVIKADSYNQKTYRTEAINYLKKLVGMKLVFFTEDFSNYYLTLIHEGVFSTKLKPSDPEMMAIRVIDALERGEDLFDFAKQDINFILLKRELTASALKEGIKAGDDSMVKIAFQDGGLKLIGDGSIQIIVSHNDAPVKDLAIVVDLNYKKKAVDDKKVALVSKKYKALIGKELKLYCLITDLGIIYDWIPYNISDFIGYKNPMEEDVMDDVLESLIAQISYRTAFNSETFHQQFGTYSPFFILGWKSYQRFFEQELEKIKIMFEEWKSRFSKVYQSGDLDQELFIKHAYLALLIKTVLISKFVGKSGQNNNINLQKIIDIFEERGVPIFLNDFFQWASEEKIVQTEIFNALYDANFIIDDLFRTIYQEMVSPATRHALGEFYTPAPLAERMVEEVYKFGQYALDPACGSGTFLVEILNFINNSNKKNEEKIEALSKIYGFDINPIAVLVARANLLLLTDKLFGIGTKVPINIFLADSLNPINDFISDIDKSKLYKKVEKKGRIKEVTKISSLEGWGASTYGETERFNMPAINDSLVINIKFFKYTEQFSELLKELDRFLSKKIEFNEMLKKIYKSINDSWLDEICEGSTTEKLRKNFEYLAKKLYDFVQLDKNHIWAYLLYNAIGVRKMKETMKGVDLIIGNPPWLTIADIMSSKYKEDVKKLSQEYDIYIGGKQSPHAEISTIFFCKTSDLYLRPNGTIFFILPATIESGEQHSKFRIFNKFKDIFMWKFSKQDIFRVHNICVGAKFGNQPLLDRLKIKNKLFEANLKNRRYEIELKAEEIYVPYNYDSVSKDNIAKRLIPLSEIEQMLPVGESFYKDKFYQGASLVPRNLIFVKVLSDGKIVPDKTLIQKEPWNFFPLENYDVESEYIFDVCKSTGLVPFGVLSLCKCFLPIERNDYNYHPDLIKPKACKIFELFSNVYRKLQERDQRKITNLWKNINHLNKLTNSMQFSEIKVIYNQVGSILKAAILKGGILVDYSLFYTSVDNLDEGYYICAILNSPCLTKQIERTGATGASGGVRNIEKRALDFPFPQYNLKRQIHIQIKELGEKLEKNVMKIIENSREKKFNEIKNKFQCKFCGKRFSKKSINRFKEDHQKKCEKVAKDYKWLEEDWVDLEHLKLEEIELDRMSVQNAIFNNPNLKEQFQRLDELVIQLLNSE